MPSGNFTLIDHLKQEEGRFYNIVDEAVAFAPELRVVPSDTIEGDAITLTVQTDLPAVRFRQYNEGSPRSKGTFENRVFSCFPLDHQCAVDKRLHENQAPEAQARLLDRHVSSVIEAGFRLIGSQFYYGTGHDPKGFPGLIAQHATDAAHNVDAGGNSDLTSVWMVRLGPECLEFLWANGVFMHMQEEWDVESLYDANGLPYQAMTNYLSGAVSLRLANKNCCVRISGIEGDVKTLNDDLLFEAYQKFTDFGHEPTHIFANSRSIGQLRSSRVTPQKPNPPLPTEWEGIPFARTANILNSEA